MFSYSENLHLASNHIPPLKRNFSIVDHRFVRGLVDGICPCASLHLRNFRFDNNATRDDLNHHLFSHLTQACYVGSRYGFLSFFSNSECVLKRRLRILVGVGNCLNGYAQHHSMELCRTVRAYVNFSHEFLIRTVDEATLASVLFQS